MQQANINGMPQCLRKTAGDSLVVCCAYDGSDISMRALELSQLFVRKDDQVLAFFCTIPGADSREGERIGHSAEAVARKLVLPNFKFELLEASSVDKFSNVIVDRADKRKAGLICTGTRHTVEGGKRALGRQTDPLVRSSHVPVAVFRPGQRKVDHNRYIVAIDGSMQTLSAVQFVLSMAQSTDEVVIVTLTDDAPKGEADLQLAAAVAAQTRSNVQTVGTRRVPRDPAVALGADLCQTVSKLEGDFLVLATGWKRWDELGSISTYCIYHVDCNLVIYKNPAYLMK